MSGCAWGISVPSGARSLSRGVIAAARVQKAYFADDFNRANGAIGSNWTANLDGSGMTINTNRMQGSGYSLWATDCLTDDEYSQATIATTSGNIFLYVRTPSTGWPNVCAIITLSSGAWTITTDPSNAGANHTTRASGSLGSGVVVAGSVPRFEVTGNVYTLKHNGSTVGSWTDSGAVIVPGPTKRKVGVQLSASGISIDDWSGGDL